ILTNRHVVRSYDIATKEYTVHEQFYVRRYNAETYRKATLVRYAQDSDLALLQQEEKAEKYVRLCKNDTLRYGQRVHTIGNGNGYGLAYAQGFVASPMCNVLYEAQTIRAVQLDLTFYEGNSGGPLLNDNGELVGITTFRLRDKQGAIVQGTGFALPLATVRAFSESENG
ncbi:MAG: serine protease, partial [Clostridiales bacterium]|nr:serine protease [Clostridiales bacterium]